MPRLLPATLSLALACSAAMPAAAQVTLPNDFEAPGGALSRLFSYFGGVADFGAEPSGVKVYAGDSLRCWANFQHDNIFHIAGFAVGTFGISRPALAVPADADTFSITVKAPQIPQTIAMLLTIREDDNNDGAIDVAGDDDEWESAPIMLMPGTHVYNLPFSEFTLSDAGGGNGVQNFTTVNRMAYFVTFETRESFPGGILEAPASFYIDHIGFFAGEQVLPPEPGCAADFDLSGTREVRDIFQFLEAWFLNQPAADIDNSGTFTISDVFAFLELWFIGC